MVLRGYRQPHDVMPFPACSQLQQDVFRLEQSASASSPANDEAENLKRVIDELTNEKATYVDRLFFCRR
jgi:hypothetical protein